MGSVRLVSVIIPVYKNAGTLLELHRRISDSLTGAGQSLELVFVNDACPDNSGAVLAHLAARDPRVRVISHARNAGQQTSLIEGIAAARGDAIVLLDADLQDPPEAIPDLLRELDTGRWSAVFAGRKGEYQARFRMLTSRLYRAIVTRLVGLPSDAGIFVAFTRPMANRILEFRVRRPYITVMIGAVGGEFLSIPVNRQTRPVGSSSYSQFMRLRAAFRAIYLSLSLTRQCSQTNRTINCSGNTTPVI